MSAGVDSRPLQLPFSQLSVKRLFSPPDVLVFG